MMVPQSSLQFGLFKNQTELKVVILAQIQRELQQEAVFCVYLTSGAIPHKKDKFSLKSKDI